jgi:TolA-binding protein
MAQRTEHDLHRKVAFLMEHVKKQDEAIEALKEEHENNMAEVQDQLDGLQDKINRLEKPRRSRRLLRLGRKDSKKN